MATVTVGSRQNQNLNFKTAKNLVKFMTLHMDT